MAARMRTLTHALAVALSLAEFVNWVWLDSAMAMLAEPEARRQREQEELKETKQQQQQEAPRMSCKDAIEQGLQVRHATEHCDG